MDRLHKLNRELMIEMAEKNQRIKELSQENQAYKKVIDKWRLQDESK